MYADVADYCGFFATLGPGCPKVVDGPAIAIKCGPSDTLSEK